MASRYIQELRVAAAEDELAAHGLAEDDVLEVSWNEPAFFKDKYPDRDLMIGRTDGGRMLTIVIQETAERGTWVVITGWLSSKGERTRWQKARPRFRTTRRPSKTT